MNIKFEIQRYIWMVLLFLTACGNQTVALPTETPTPTAVSSTLIPTSTIIPFTITPSPLPTQQTIPIITPDPVQVERWKEYEAALGEVIFKEAPLVLCEWEIVGQTDQEVYVWAICTNMDGTGSVPAVIYLNPDGTVQNAAYTGSIPGLTFTEALSKLFPADIQEKFRYIDKSDMSAHLEKRRTHPEEPPLIILSATPMP